MSPGPVTGELRAVLDAPRGRRFSRPGTAARLMATPPGGFGGGGSGFGDSASSTPASSTSAFRARERRLLAQMADNPRVAHRQAHGVLPAWVYEHATRLAERDGRPLPERPADAPPIPRPRPAPDDGPPPPRPRPARPPLPKRPRSHRKPRRRRRSRPWWHLLGYTLATLTGGLAGALAHHLDPVLF